MKMREIIKNVYWLGAVDWDRRLFDSLIPLPDGTSYNAYLIKGKEKTALIDSVDPPMTEKLLEQLSSISQIDYIISHHSEQDHSGAIPAVLELFPSATVLTTEKGKDMLTNHLLIPEEQFKVVEDGEEISLGDKTLRFIHTPWVHWPETMVSYLVEDKILFSCDFFGSHIATTDLYVTDEGLVYEAAKRYFAEIMMPFSNIIKRNMTKIAELKIKLICPSHGPIYDKPEFILNAYEEWISDKRENLVVIPYVSMHGTTRKMVEYLVGKLAEEGITAYQFDLVGGDIGKLAINLVGAATVVLGTPTIHAGPHPLAVYATYLLNAIRPKIKFITVIGSYGWFSNTVKQVVAMVPKLKNAEILTPVYCKGYPKEEDFKALDQLVQTIVEKHKSLKLL
ncbi:MAG: FprA family A-type flavoprotein [Candidatus Heimdallarchaeum endolithica]|uniref:FprA family A-type flavoprotein n=1 Tax=Candidatus Heimdallarchaeum endolithica TaxID=2876572 RepID=A0A9Y1BSX6_9ARCH|nr:MAG: FprA family A-type flavoprotein [Candidatus Heimdallarchaeum endolithica]